LSAKKLVIAIDGPAASGKSTTAKLVAQRMGYLHVDTGAMYRAVTLKILRAGIDPRDEPRVAELARRANVEFRPDQSGLRVLLDGDDVTEEIRSVEVTQAVSAVSSIPAVRGALVDIQKRMGSKGGIVLEGRDIGTVVFPDADLKIFMVADLDERVKRRHKELRARGESSDSNALKEEIRRRDKLDSTRKESPLVKAPDAIEVDTSGLTVEEQVEFVVCKAKEILGNR